MKIQTYQDVDTWENRMELEKAEVVKKEKAHKDGLLHLSTHLLVVNAADNVYCRFRAPTELRYQDMWTTSIGTHVEMGDDYLATLKKHLPKEMKLVYLGEFRVDDGYENEVNGLFIARLEESELPESFRQDRSFLTTKTLESSIAVGKTTPHLKEAYKLYRSKNE